MSEKRTIKWVPDSFKNDAVPAREASEGKPAKEAIPEKVLYEGHLIVEVPLSEDRCELLMELGLKETEVTGTDTAVRSAKEALDVYRRYGKKLLVGCEVVRVRDQKKMSLEEVLTEPELVMLPVQMGWKYIGGFAAGNE